MTTAIVTAKLLSQNPQQSVGVTGQPVAIAFESMGIAPAAAMVINFLRGGCSEVQCIMERADGYKEAFLAIVEALAYYQEGLHFEEREVDKTDSIVIRFTLKGRK